MVDDSLVRKKIINPSRKPHAETTKDPRFNVSPFYILSSPEFEPACVYKFPFFNSFTA